MMRSERASEEQATEEPERRAALLSQPQPSSATDNNAGVAWLYIICFTMQRRRDR
jgi:hypothetical protein